MHTAGVVLFTLFFFAETLDRWQRKAVLSNPGLDLEVPVEIGVIFLAHFADEMLLRAVVLQGKLPLCFMCTLGQWQDVPVHCYLSLCAYTRGVYHLLAALPSHANSKLSPLKLNR